MAVEDEETLASDFIFSKDITSETANELILDIKLIDLEANINFHMQKLKEATYVRDNSLIEEHSLAMVDFCRQYDELSPDNGEIFKNLFIAYGGLCAVSNIREENDNVIYTYNKMLNLYERFKKISNEEEIPVEMLGVLSICGMYSTISFFEKFYQYFDYEPQELDKLIMEANNIYENAISFSEKYRDLIGYDPSIEYTIGYANLGLFYTEKNSDTNSKKKLILLKNARDAFAEIAGDAIDEHGLLFRDGMYRFVLTDSMYLLEDPAEKDRNKILNSIERLDTLVSKSDVADEHYSVADLKFDFSYKFPDDYNFSKNLLESAMTNVLHGYFKDLDQERMLSQMSMIESDLDDIVEEPSFP